jgi:glycosyltransferase involved in cell wall biosynthesis
MNNFHSLKVVHLTASIGPLSGGLGPIAVGLTKGQRLLGAKPQIWTIDVPSKKAELLQANGLDSSELNTFSAWKPYQIGFAPAMEREAISAKGEAVDVIHQHSIWLLLSRVTRNWQAAFSRPTVINPQGTLEEYTLKISSLKKRLALVAYERENLNRAACLQATSSYEADSFRRFGLKNPIAIIPNGVSKNWLESEGNAARFRAKFVIPSSRRLLLFLSRLHPKKGLPLLFEALEQTPNLESWFLIVAGYEDFPNYQKELVRVSRNLGIANNILFIDGLFGQDKRDAFEAADLFILPTHSDNFAIVVTEALAAGVPVLTTHGAPWEQLQTRGCGWWVKVNTEAISDALLDAINRPQQELLAMGTRGKNLVSEQYTWEKIAHKTLLMYEWLLGRVEQPDFVLSN